MLTLIRAGLYTSVQDGGREGLRQSGISRCGALDYPSLVAPPAKRRWTAKRSGWAGAPPTGPGNGWC